MRRALETLPRPPWCNVTAYPVEPVRWEGALHSRFDTATTLLGRLAPRLTNAIRGADGDVVGATRAVNRMLGMNNDFPIFMAVMDLAWFRPEVIDPASPVPTGHRRPWRSSTVFRGTSASTTTPRPVNA